MDTQPENTETFAADTMVSTEIALTVQTAILRYARATMQASPADNAEKIAGILAGLTFANAELIMAFAGVTGFDSDAMAEGQATLLRNQVARRGSAGTG